MKVVMADTAADPSNRAFQPQDSDIHVSIEDQGRINQFARCNAKKEDLKAELASKQSQLKNIEDASEELSLMDEDNAMIPFQCGDLFIYLNMDETNQALDTTKNKIMSEINRLKGEGCALKIKMAELRAHLYSKFGTRINLEDEEEE